MQDTRTFGLYMLTDPRVLADPYPLYDRLRSEDPVHWDPFLKAWVVTRYEDVVRVLHDREFSARRTPSPEQLSAMGLDMFSPIAEVMVRQMLFLDPPGHTRLRNLAGKAFTPRRIEALRPHIQDVVDELIDRVEPDGRMDLIGDLAVQLPTIITSEMLGVPREDCEQLKEWSIDFAGMLGNFQHNPDRAPKVASSVREMTEYFRDTIRHLRVRPRDGVINALLTAEFEGDRLSEEEVIANSIITMVGGQETTTNLIGNGVYNLWRHPDQLERLRREPTLLPSAIEEMLRYESPIQHTARMAIENVELGGKLISNRQAVMAVMGAANRDPDRFPDPEKFDIARPDNRHLAFGWASHFCFGAPLARMEARVAFSTLLARLPNLELECERVTWQPNLAYRGLVSLPVRF